MKRKKWPQDIIEKARKMRADHEWGARKISTALFREGINVSQYTVQEWIK